LEKILILELKSETKKIVSLSDYITNKFEQRSSTFTDFVKLNFEQVADILNILERIDNCLMVYSDNYIRDEVYNFFTIMREDQKKLKHFLAQTLTIESENQQCWEI